MKKQDPIVVWDESGHSLFERFAVQLRNYTHTGRLPKMGDQDIQYGLELQKERLKEKKLLMKYEFTPRGHFADKNSVNRSW